MTKYNIGYTAGVFDMFHIGHLNLIQRAKEQCNYLIVGINSDELVKQYKEKIPVINQTFRMRIVEALRDVDKAVMVETLDKMEAWNSFNFNVIFIGDDWLGNSRWKETEEALSKIGVKVVYVPYTHDVSSTVLRLQVDNRAEEL